MPLFSIGVTTYDRFELLAQTLSSIRSQTFNDFEVIIGNDNPERTLTPEAFGFTDERFKFVNHPHNLGELKNMNELLRLSSGRYFTWLADDDLYDPILLANVAKALEKFDYPNVVFTSYQDFRENADPKPTTIEPDVNRMTGRDFIRGYLSEQVKAIGVMGFFSTDYLKALGGLEDVSADGMGLYCEYMILIRCGLEDRIGYVNAPLVFYRIHEGAWGILNSNLEQYDRAAKNLLTRSAEVFATPQLEGDFTQNIKQLLKRVMIQYINVAGGSSRFRARDLLRYFRNVHSYLSDKHGDKFYRRGLLALRQAQVWIVSVLIWRKILATGPSRPTKFVQSLLRGRRPDDNVSAAER